MGKIKVGVAGLGIGKRHAMEYLESKKAKVVAVADINKKLLKEFCSQYNVKGYRSLEEMLKNERLDGISICTPPSSHLALVKLAAENKVHVLCEKPIAPTINDAKKMIKVCRKKKVKLMIGFKKRFSPTYQFLKERFEKEFRKPTWVFAKFVIGRVDSEWFWKEDDGGGPIVENTIHIIDLLRFLIGDIERVYGEGGTLFLNRRFPQIDGTVFTMKFRNKTVASIGAGYASEWKTAREEISFANEKIVGEVSGKIDYPDNLYYFCRDKPEKMYKKRFLNSEGFKGEIKHFLECIMDDKSPLASGEDGLEALKISLAVKKSIRTGKVSRINCETYLGGKQVRREF